MTPTISVVIPVYNGGEAFVSCLDALLVNSHDHFEVIVVDDASTDRSAAEAEARGVHVIRQPTRSGPSVARNAGAAQARGEILALLDADVVLPADALSRAEAFLRDTPGIAGFSAVYTADSRVQGFGSQYLNLKQRYFQLQLPDISDTAWTAFFVVWRERFLSCGGLDTALHHPAADDLVLGSRMAAAGHRLAFCRDLEVEHLKELSVVETWRFHFVHAREWSRASRRYQLLRQQKVKHSKRPVGNTILGSGLVVLLMGAPVGVLIFPLWGGAIGGTLVVGAVWNADFMRWLAQHRGWYFAVRALPVTLIEGVANAAGMLRALPPSSLAQRRS